MLPVSVCGVAVIVAAQGIALIYETGLAFAGVQPRVRKTLDLIGVDKALSLYDTVGDALDAVRERSQSDVAGASGKR